MTIAHAFYVTVDFREPTDEGRREKTFYFHEANHATRFVDWWNENKRGKIVSSGSIQLTDHLSAITIAKYRFEDMDTDDAS